jgi:hypothetical protein
MFTFVLSHAVLHISDTNAVQVELEHDSEILNQLQALVDQLADPPESDTLDNKIQLQLGALLCKLGLLLHREGADYLEGGTSIN